MSHCQDLLPTKHIQSFYLYFYVFFTIITICKKFTLFYVFIFVILNLWCFQKKALWRMAFADLQRVVKSRNCRWDFHFGTEKNLFRTRRPDLPVVEFFLMQRMWKSLRRCPSLTRSSPSSARWWTDKQTTKQINKPANKQINMSSSHHKTLIEPKDSVKRTAE